MSPLRRTGLVLMLVGVVTTGVGVVGELLDADGDEEPEVVETPQEFFTLLDDGFQRGDAEFLFDRLHPAVLDLYGEAQCLTYLSSLDAPDAIEVVEVYRPEAWFYGTRDDRQVLIEDAVRVDLVERIGDEEVELEAHLAPGDDGTFRWFTDCGDPIS